MDARNDGNQIKQVNNYSNSIGGLVMAIVVTFGVQKGGCGKTTTTGIMAHLMSEEGFKVLVIDMDSQGNATDFLLDMDPADFAGETIIEAFEKGDIKPFIRKINDNLDIVPSDDYLSTLAKFLYTTRKGKIYLALNELLEPIQNEYDYVLIDTPPSLSEPMTNSLCASDFVVILAECSHWAHTAIQRFMETIDFAKDNVKPNLQIAGILRTMTDVRRSDAKFYQKKIGDEYSDLVFDTVIKRNAATGRLPILGFENNKELKQALTQYYGFYEELRDIIGVVENV